VGFYSSFRLGNIFPSVNINICMSAFYEPGKLADALRSFLMVSFDAIPRELMRSLVAVSPAQSVPGSLLAQSEVFNGFICTIT
jgi:Argonaute linker 1 domain